MNYALLHLTKTEIIVYALSLAFVITQMLIPHLHYKYCMWRYRRWDRSSHQPQKILRCMQCLTAWLTFIFALTCGYYAESLLLLFTGLFIGAVAESLIMKYL